VLDASGLRARVEVPDTAYGDSAGGWLLVYVSVRNPLDRHVVVRLRSSPGAPEAAAFGYQLGSQGDQDVLPSEPFVLGPHAVLRRAFDAQLQGYPARRYPVSATFNGTPGDSTSVVVVP
jgi:hypothetical protein